MAATVSTLLLLTAGCGPGNDPPPPTLTGCTDSQCLTATPDQADSTDAPPSNMPSSTPQPAFAAATPARSPEPGLIDSERNEAQVAYQSAAVSLGPVIWATEIDPESRAPRVRVEEIPGDTKTIYAVLAVEHISAGTAVQAQWSYNRTRLDAFDQSVVAEATGTNTWLEFHLALTQPGTWPRGSYQVNIMVSGETAVTGSVEVVDDGT